MSRSFVWSDNEMTQSNKEKKWSTCCCPRRASPQCTPDVLYFQAIWKAMRSVKYNFGDPATVKPLRECKEGEAAVNLHAAFEQLAIDLPVGACLFEGEGKHPEETAVRGQEAFLKPGVTSAVHQVVSTSLHQMVAVQFAEPESRSPDRVGFLIVYTMRAPGVKGLLVPPITGKPGKERARPAMNSI